MEKKENMTKKNKKSVGSSAKKSTGTKKKTTSKKIVNSTKTEPKKEVQKVEVTSKKEEKKVAVTPVIKPNYEEEPEFAGSEIRKLLIIIGAVCAVMLSFYFITEFVLKNKKEKAEETKQETTIPTEIQYEEILMGSMFNQGSGEYYVLAYVEDDNLLSTYNSYIKTYTEIEGHKKVYKVNLSSDFNKSYLADTPYIEGNDASKIKVSGTTLIKIIDNTVSYSYTEPAKIIDKFQRLIG